MKKKISLLLTFALIMTSLLSLFVLQTSAASYASDAEALAAGCYARIGEEGAEAKYYTSFGTAAADCPDNGTIYMIGSFKLKDDSRTAIECSAKKTINLDGNGYTLSGKYSQSIFRTWGTVNSGHVVIKNIKFENAGTGCVIDFNAGPAVTLENVTVTSTNTGTTCLGAIVARNEKTILNSGTEIYSMNTLTARNGDTSTATNGQGTGIRLDGTLVNSVTINEGVKIQTPNSAIHLNSATTEVEINGGTFITNNVNSCGGAIYALAGKKLTINGGLFMAQGDALMTFGTVDTTINGGVFRPLNDEIIFKKAWMIRNGLGSTREGKTLTVNSGTFYYPNGSAAQPLFRSYDTKDNLHTTVINGGDFLGTAYIFNGGSKGPDAGKTIVLENPVMMDGASIRTVKDSNGIRFRSSISKAAIDVANAAKKEGTELVFGTLIAPLDLVTDGLLTKSALTAGSYVDIVAKDGMVTNEDGSVELSAALINLNEKNLDRKFVAVAYISYQTENGTVTVYASYEEDDNARSMREIAYKALADVTAASDGYYTTPVTEWYALENNAWVKKTGNAFSAYSAEQLAVIKTYIAD